MEERLDHAGDEAVFRGGAVIRRPWVALAGKDQRGVERPFARAQTGEDLDAIAVRRADADEPAAERSV